MINQLELENSLRSLGGFKALHTGLLAAKKAKDAFRIYSNAREKGVYELITLREELYDKKLYKIMAFSLDGEIKEETRVKLEEKAEQIPAGAVRFYSMPYKTLALNRTIQEAAEYNGPDQFLALTNEFEHVFVFCYTDFKEVELACSFAIHALADEGHYIFAVPDCRLIG